MRPVHHFVIVILGILTPFAAEYILETPKLPLQILAGVGVAAILDRTVHLLALLRARSQRTAGVGARI